MTNHEVEEVQQTLDLLRVRLKEANDLASALAAKGVALSYYSGSFNFRYLPDKVIGKIHKIVKLT